MKTICFTGFSKNKKNELVERATSLGYIVSKDVTKGLNFLCCGDNAGPSKINKAKQNNASLVSEENFLTFPPVEEFPAESAKETIVPTMTIYDESELLDLLWSAIDSNKTISIFYHGGSLDGVERSIIPLTLLDNFTLRAVDLSSSTHTVKSFSVEKIEIPGIKRLTLPENQRNKTKKKQYSAGLYKHISDVHSAFNDTLVGMGWHVATYFDDSGLCERLDVCDYFKNGKPRKSPVVSLSYQPENKTRPYVCRCRDIEFTSTYAHLDNAAEMFISLAYSGSELASEEE